jgi:hypothetical protein
MDLSAASRMVNNFGARAGIFGVNLVAKKQSLIF